MRVCVTSLPSLRIFFVKLGHNMMSTALQISAVGLCMGLMGTSLAECFRFHKIEFFASDKPRILSKADVLHLTQASQHHSVLVDAELVTRVAPLLYMTLAMIFWFNVKHMLVPFLVILALIVFFPHMQKPSKFYPYCSQQVYYRSWKHMLMYTSLLYGTGCFFALYCGYYYICFLCAMTTFGSLLYHRHREGQFFNFDNVFATTKLLIFLYTMVHAVDNEVLYSVAALLSLPVIAFIFIYCGDPADISLVDQKCSRDNRAVYDLYHSLWHVVSAVGPVAACVYLHLHPFDPSPPPPLPTTGFYGSVKHPHLMHVDGILTQEEYLVLACLVLAVCVNMLLNALRVAPMC